MPAADAIDYTHLRTLLAITRGTPPCGAARCARGRIGFDFVDVPMIHSAFKRVVRDPRIRRRRACARHLPAGQAWGKPLTLVPLVLFNQPYPQHAALVYRASGATLRPQDLVNKRIGVRALSVTTVMWCAAFYSTNAA